MASAKSWLAHPGVDRHAAFLPLGDSGWWLWRDVALRSPGFPARLARDLGDVPAPGAAPKVSAAEQRAAKKEMGRIEGQLAKLRNRMDGLNAQMADAASDYTRLAELQAELQVAADEADELELAWLEAAETAEG